MMLGADAGIVIVFVAEVQVPPVKAANLAPSTSMMSASNMKSPRWNKLNNVASE